MAKQVWQCKYCNKVHVSKTDAEQCESIHSGVKKVLAYEFEVGHNDKYPKSIKCLMENGETVVFYRSQVGYRGGI